MSQPLRDPILSEVASYYSEKFAEHGATPKGVDWNGEASQTLRFRQLCNLIRTTDTFSINDLGCGYGALYEFLTDEYARFSYTGIDVSESMITAAARRYAGHHQARFVRSGAPEKIADYGVASGIFNVRMGHSDEEWRRYLEETLDLMDRTSSKGFAFNCLTVYSDKDKLRDYLYYADPAALFDLCKRRYSRNVALLHDYGLYEFTILVRKSS